MKKLLLILFTTLSFYAQAQLDPAFGNNGISFAGNEGISGASEIIESPSGKYYATGTYQSNYYYYPFVLAFEHDGTPDASFGNNGVLLLSSDTALYFSSYMLEQADDGKIYLGYTRFKNNAGSRATVRQIDTFGVVNPAFGNAGLLSYTSPNFNDILLVDMQLDLKNKIVLSARYRTTSGDYHVHQSRYLSNGLIDASFNSGGVDTSFEMDPAYAIRTRNMPDSSIISCYKRDNFSSFTFIKFDKNGKIDSSFGTNGSFHYFFHINGSSIPSEVTDLHVMDDTTLLFGGVRTLSNNEYLCMGRLQNNGTLDSTFGANGIVAHNTISRSGTIILDAQDRIYVNDLGSFKVHRYLSNGTFDINFAVGGTYNLRPYVFTGASRFLLLTDSTKILISGGYTDELKKNSKISLQRFNLSQTIDNSFGTQGAVEPSIGLAADYTFGICVSKNDQLVMVGRSAIPSTNFFARSNIGLVSKLEKNGSLDATFGRNGLETYPRFSSAHDVIEQADGKLIVAGTDGNGNSFTMTRLFPNGAIDSSFAIDGFSQARHFYNRDYLAVIDQDSQGRIYASSSRNRALTMFRYTADGFGDSTFAMDFPNFPGQAIIDLNGGPIQERLTFFPQDLSVLSDDKPVVSGFYNALGVFNSKGGIVRWLPTGVPDSSFGVNGLATLDLSPDSVVFWQHSIQDNGKIVAAGYRQKNGIKDIVVARFNSNGTPDNFFGTNGYVTYSINGFNDQGNTVITQSAGTIMIMGNAQLNATLPLNEFYAMRLTKTGNLDNTYGTNGVFKFSTSTNGDEIIFKSVMDSEGRIVLAGYSNQDGQDEMFAAKLLTSFAVGVLDVEESSQILFLYPNPIRDQANLDFELNDKQTISIQLVDMTGRVVKRFAQQQSFERGKHTLPLGFENLANGNYILQLGNASFNQSIQLTVGK